MSKHCNAWNVIYHWYFIFFHYPWQDIPYFILSKLFSMSARITRAMGLSLKHGNLAMFCRNRKWVWWILNSFGGSRWKKNRFFSVFFFLPILPLVQERSVLQQISFDFTNHKIGINLKILQKRGRGLNVDDVPIQASDIYNMMLLYVQCTKIYTYKH